MISIPCVTRGVLKLGVSSRFDVKDCRVSILVHVSGAGKSWIDRTHLWIYDMQRASCDLFWRCKDAEWRKPDAARGRFVFARGEQEIGWFIVVQIFTMDCVSYANIVSLCQRRNVRSSEHAEDCDCVLYVAVQQRGGHCQTDEYYRGGTSWGHCVKDSPWQTMK